MLAKTKTIKMLLYDGSLNGVMNISDSAWEIGKMYSAPKDSISDLIAREDCKKYGVYLLLSDKQVYVGQASDLEKRTKQHLTDKDWWTKTVLMTTKDDSFNASDIDYLESRLIDMAYKAGTADSDNKKKGNPKKVDEFRQAELEQYLDEALFLLELIGVRVFKGASPACPKLKTKSCDSHVSTEVPFATISKPKEIKPLLPKSDSLGPCAFAKQAFENLISSGYHFSDEQIARYGSIEGSKEYTKRNLPIFWILKDGETRRSCEKTIRERYWKEEYCSGKYRFLMFSQWYDNPKKGSTREQFISWYNTL